MTFYKKSITIDESRQVILSDLPFSARQKLQVIIVVDESEGSLDENATIEAVMQQYRQQGKLRPCGLCAREFIVPDDFNKPLPDEVIDLFYPQ
ncbi:hypothetical protein [Laspinema olomoucense]|uniref:Uncharacterized protein n=1 Tax=Laspinema olomoucense D3b TaxID=2953688 RepID=A0ABT2NDI5_9CYAN|nr:MULTISPECIES: hypothetical protein [unclassified Laspinema]MCT7975358.1 hypothetical protein [Laspinema sp. D3d]MCT7980742.1 hypothetical protein [Laspinema sp. D3b]MCT7993881.1 hypothetical protein [Laspinema sp. D3c]